MGLYIWIFLISIASIWFLDAVFHGLKKAAFFREHFPVRRTSEPKGRLHKLMASFMDSFARYNNGIITFYDNSMKNKSKGTFAPGLGIIKLFWIFMIANVFGSFLETIWCLVLNGFFEMRTSMVYGFIIPIYGLGATMMTICLCRFYKKRSFSLFLGSAVIGGAVEYASSVFQEVFFGTKSWDYSNTPFNLDGRTNLMFAFIWGFLGVVWVKILYPGVSRMIEKIPRKTGFILTIALFAFILLDTLLTTAALHRQIERHNGIPAVSHFDKYLDRNFNDDYLYWVYPNMRYISK